MLARSRHLQGIFGLLKPFLHVQILICFVDVYQNHGVNTTVRAIIIIFDLSDNMAQNTIICGFGSISGLKF